jgi:hypothetical protein
MHGLLASVFKVVQGWEQIKRRSARLKLLCDEQVSTKDKSVIRVYSGMLWLGEISGRKQRVA